MKTLNYKGGKIYTVPLDDIEYIGYFYGKKGNEDVKSAMKRITKLRGCAPDFLMNAELFDFKTRRAASDVVENGEVHRLTESYGFAFPENKTAVFSYKNNVKAADYIGAYPALVRNGVEEKQNPAGITGVRGRTALGLDNDELYIILIPDRGGVSLAELRQKLVSMGVSNAINLDGGGSTQYYAPGGNYFSGRKVRGFIGIWYNSQDMYAVKVKTSLRVRCGPGYFYKRIGNLYNGDKIKVYEKSGAWCRIGDGRWVHSSYLKKV